MKKKPPGLGRSRMSLDLLREVEKKRDLKLGAKEKLVALEKRVSLDATVVTRLHKEWDEPLKTVGGSAQNVV